MLWCGGLRWLRLFAGIICVLIFLLGVLFSLSNQETIVVKLLPFAFIVEAPIYLILLIVLFIGVFLGGICTWVSGAGARRRVRQQARRLKWFDSKLQEERVKRYSLESQPEEDVTGARLVGENSKADGKNV